MASGGEVSRQKGIEELEQEVTCPVCHDHFQNPKILPCLHYYCKQCIQALAWRAGVNQPFPCPECRTDTILPQNDPDQLPTAFFINRMKEVHAKLEKVQGKVTTKCEMCPGGAATAFCRQCAEFICEKCTESHHRMKVFADHEVSTLEELKEGGGRIIVTKPPPPPTCKIHEEQAKLYCFTCTTLICRDCIVIDHKDHKYEFVKKATPMVKEVLTNGIISLRDVQKTIHDAANCVREAKVKISEQGEMIATSVHQSFEVLHEVLNEQEQKLLKKASSAVEKKIGRLTLQEENMNMSSTMIQSVIDFVEKNIENTTEEELVSQHSQFLCKIEEAAKKVQSLKPTAEPDMVVNVLSSSDLKQLCRLKTNVSIPTCAVLVEVEDEGECEVGKALNIKMQPKSHPIDSLEVECQLISTHNGVITSPNKVIVSGSDTYEVEFIPTVRGYHTLQIMADGLTVTNSSLPIFVNMPPIQLCNPVKTIDMTEEPRGIAIKPTGEILISTRTAVVSTDKNGEKFNILTSSEQYDLYGIAIDQDDYIYVSESCQDRLLKLNSKGEIVKTYRTHMPRGVTVHNNDIYLCGSGSRRVHKLNKELQFKKDLTLPNLNWPSEAIVNADGQMIYICDHESNHIVVYSKGFGVKSRIPSKKLSRPCAVCISGSLIFVSEWGENQVSVLTKVGQVVTTFGHGQLQRPSRIAIDSNGFVYVCDTGNNRVQVF